CFGSSPYQLHVGLARDQVTDRGAKRPRVVGHENPDTVGGRRIAHVGLPVYSISIGSTSSELGEDCLGHRVSRVYPNRSSTSSCRRPGSLTIAESRPSLAITVRTMQAPARMTSARLGCRPTISRRSSAVRPA